MEITIEDLRGEIIDVLNDTWDLINTGPVDPGELEQRVLKLIDQLVV